jgi:hypothetical protein
MIDTLDANLPLKRLLVTNHYPLKANLSIVQGRILVVEFPEANLSSLESNSASAGGFVEYQVDLTQKLSLNQEIDNIAWVDFDSRFLESSGVCTVTLADLLASRTDMTPLAFEVYPNPSSDIWNVTFSNNRARTWTLFDAKGQICQEGVALSNQMSISASALKPGLYWLSIEGQGTVLIKP